MSSTELEATETVTELQIELRDANGLVNEIKSENEELRQHLESANAFSKANQQRHAEWKAAWKVEREVLLLREKQLEKDEAEWKAKLDDLRKESGELERRKFMNNIEGAKVHGSVGLELLKDLETEHASKTEALINEASKWRDQYHASRMVCEELKAQYEQLQSRSERERSVSESIQKEIYSLQHALAEQIERSNNGSSSTEVIARDLKHQLSEKEWRLEKLHQDVKSMQKARDDALSAKHELVASHQAELARMIQDVANYKANNLTLERRIQATTKEATLAVTAKTEFEESAKSALKELASLQKSMAAKEERNKQEMDQLCKELAQSDSMLTLQLASIKNLLVEEQARCKELERQCLDVQEFAMKQISDLAKDLKQIDDSKEQQLLFAKDQIAQHENTIAELQRDLAHTHQNHQNEVQRLQHACEACHKDLNLVLFERKEMEKSIAADNVKVARMQKVLEETETSMQKLESKYQVIEGEKAILVQNLDELNDEKDALRNKLKCASEDMRLLKEREASEREKIEGALKNEVGKVRQELAKEKRRSNAYKSKALESHRRSVQAKEVLDSLCG